MCQFSRRPARGQTYGATYIDKYRDDIKSMFERGEAVSTDKMSPALMLEKLQDKYKGRYSLPGENEIRTEIATLFQGSKNCDASVEDESSTRSKLPKVYEQFIVAEVNALLIGKAVEEMSFAELDEALKGAKPAHIMKSLVEKFQNRRGNLPSDFPSDAKIRAKIGGYKTRLKNKARLNIIG